MKKALENKKVIDLNKLTLNEIKEMKTDSEYRCPYCLEPVRLKRGKKRKAHFAHITPCLYEYNTNESEEHELAKKYLFTWLQNQNIQTEIEHPIRQIRRVADLYFHWQGKKYVIEIQKSPLPEQVFVKRTMDYESLGISVIWIFIGDIVRQGNTFVLNRVMVLNKNHPIIHFNLNLRMLTVFWQIIWISTKEIQAKHQRYLLDRTHFEQLIMLPKDRDTLTRKQWIEIKVDFRKYRWHSYFKYDRRLQQMCIKNHTNLSLLPAEVGWPVMGSGIRKSIFIWQAYILLNIISSYEVGDFFTLGDMVRKLKAWQRVEVPLESLHPLKAYLEILVKFEMLDLVDGYYEYKKAPIFYKRLEDVLIEDEKLSLLFFQN